MKLPDISNSMSIAGWRYIQSIHEPPERRNPDNLVGQFLSVAERWHAKWLSQKKLAVLRSRPFYYYLVARTKYYDATFLDAINCDTRNIINIGSGSDTRAYRFLDKLTPKGITVLECDQPQAIRAKQQIAERHWPS